MSESVYKEWVSESKRLWVNEQVSQYIFSPVIDPILHHSSEWMDESSEYLSQ